MVEVTQREGVGEDGKKQGLVILEEPHHLWAQQPGDKVWPERQRKAQGGHLE